MKLIYVANIRIPTEKAHGIQIMKMCESFSKYAEDVELVVPNRNNSIRDDPFKYYSVENSFKIKKIFTLDLIRFGKIGFYLQSISFALSALLFVFNRKDLIYSRDISILYLLSFFKKDIYWEAHTAHDNFMAKRVFRKAKGIIPITKGLKDYYENKFGKRENILVSSDAVDLKEFESNKTKEEIRAELRLPKDRKILGYIGKMTTMGESKGVEEIIYAFPELLSNVSSSFLLLVGANKNEISELVKIFEEKGVGMDSYRIVEHVGRLEAVKYMKASDALVMNYPNSEHYAYYMSPLKMFEYMASGAVVVTTDLPSIREILDAGTAVFVKAGDQNDLTKKISDLFRDENKIKNISRACLEKIKEYTWKKRAKNILDFISREV